MELNYTHKYMYLCVYLCVVSVQSSKMIDEHALVYHGKSYIYKALRMR